MTDLSGAMRGTLVQMRGNPVAARASLPAMSGQESASLLASPPSVGLVAALGEAMKREEGPITYTAANGEVVRMSRGPLVVVPSVANEARSRLAALEVAMATRPHPADLAEWLYDLARRAEKAPTGDDLDRHVRGLCRDLHDMPACLFTNEIGRQIARDLVWWPSYAKLANALDRLQAPMVAEKRRLEAVIAAAAPPAPAAVPSAPSARRPPTAEEVAAVQAKAKALADAVPPREGKRWLPLPVEPVRSVEEQLAALKGWATPMSRPSHASQRDVP